MRPSQQQLYFVRTPSGVLISKRWYQTPRELELAVRALERMFPGERIRVVAHRLRLRRRPPGD